MRAIDPDKKSKRKKKYELFDPEYLCHGGGSSTPTNIETRLIQLIECLEQPLPSKYRKPAIHLLQVVLPGLLKLHKNNSRVIGLISVATVGIIAVCDYSDCSKQLQQAMEMLVQSKADVEPQSKLVKILQKTQLFVKHYNRAMLVRLLECVGTNSGLVRKFGVESLAIVLMGDERNNAINCWLGVMSALNEPTLKSSLRGVLIANGVPVVVRNLYGVCKEKQLLIPNFPQLLLEGAYAGMLREIMQQSQIHKFDIDILLPIFEHPKLEYFEKLSQLYELLVNSRKELKVLGVNVLRLHRSIPLKDLQQKSDQGYYNLSEFCKMLQNSLISEKPQFIKELAEVIIKQPEIFSFSFYQKLLAEQQNHQILYPLLGKSFNTRFNNNSQILSPYFRALDVIQQIVEHNNPETCYFESFILELNPTALLSLSTDILIQYFIAANKKHNHELLFVEQHLCDNYALWAILARQIVKEKQIDLAESYIGLLASCSDRWLDSFLKKMREGYLETLLNRKDIKSLYTFFLIATKLPTSPDLAATIVPFFVNRFRELSRLFSDKQKIVGQIMFSDGINWSEQQRQSHIHQMQIQGKLAVSLVNNVLKAVSYVKGLDKYVQSSPDSVSTMVLAYINEFPQQKQKVEQHILRIIGRLEQVSSKHSFSSYVSNILKSKYQTPLKHRNLSLYAGCLKQLVIHKVQYPDLTHDWHWHTLCELSLSILKLSVKECSNQKDVLIGKTITLETCQILMQTAEDWLFNKNVFDLVIRILMKGQDLVGKHQLGYTLELRSEALCLLVELLTNDERNKKFRLEGILALQYIAVDECLQLRILLIKLIIDGSLKEQVFLGLILKNDPNTIVSTLASYYLKQIFAEIELNSFANLILQYAFFLKNHESAILKEKVRGTFLGLLNADTISVMYSLLHCMKSKKVRTCHLQNGLRLLYKVQAIEQLAKLLADTEQALIKKAQNLKLKGIKLRKLQLTDHQLLEC